MMRKKELERIFKTIEEYKMIHRECAFWPACLEGRIRSAFCTR